MSRPADCGQLVLLLLCSVHLTSAGDATTSSSPADLVTSQAAEKYAGIIKESSLVTLSHEQLQQLVLRQQQVINQQHQELIARQRSHDQQARLRREAAIEKDVAHIKMTVEKMAAQLSELSAVQKITYPCLQHEQFKELAPNISNVEGRVYYMSAFPRSWQCARDFCREHGMDLVCLETSEEFEAFKAFIATKYPSGLQYIWLGGSDAASEGEWVWEPTGRSIEFNNFATAGNSEPNSDQRNCLAGALVYTSFLWTFNRCEGASRFVCEAQCT